MAFNPRRTFITDTFGIEIEVGDRVRVAHYGWNARKVDVGSVVTITGTNRQGTLSHDSDEVANGRPLRGSVLGVLRRDGGDGYEGNVGR